MKPMDSLPGWPRRPLERLTAIHAARVELDGMLDEAVQQARADGATWEQIGTALDVSKQYAWERWRDV